MEPDKLSVEGLLQSSELTMAEELLKSQSLNHVLWSSTTAIPDRKLTVVKWYVIVGVTVKRVMLFWKTKQVIVAPVMSYFDTDTNRHVYTMCGKDCFVGTLFQGLRNAVDAIDSHKGDELNHYTTLEEFVIPVIPN